MFILNYNVKELFTKTNTTVKENNLDVKKHFF